MNFVQLLWSDEAGSILTTESVLLGTVVVVGTTVGVHKVADALTAELGEVSGALRALDQSYSFEGFKSCKAQTAGSRYTQPRPDECEPHRHHEEHHRREEHKRHEDRHDGDKRDDGKKPESRHEDRRDDDKRDDDKKPEMRRGDDDQPEPRSPRRPEYPRRPENKRTEDVQPAETKPVETGKPQPGGN